jgi:hypothetical protein
VLREAYESGQRKAASWLDVLLGTSTPLVARAALRNFAPNLVPTIDKHLDTALQAGKRLVSGPTPETALAKALNHASVPASPLTSSLYQEVAPKTRLH